MAIPDFQSLMLPLLNLVSDVDILPSLHCREIS